MKLGNDVFLFYEVAKFILKFAIFLNTTKKPESHKFQAFLPIFERFLLNVFPLTYREIPLKNISILFTNILAAG